MPPHPSHPLPLDFQGLYPRFVKKHIEEVTQDIEILEMVQATLYVMVDACAIEVGVLSRVIRHTLVDALEDLRWYSFEIWLETLREALLANHP